MKTTTISTTKSRLSIKKTLFFRRQDDEHFKEKNPFRQVPINAPSHWSILQKDKWKNPLLWERQEESTGKILGSGNLSARRTKSEPENLQHQNVAETTMRSLFGISKLKSSRR
ncbi:MAG: hypothetical protein ACYTFW_07955 [Planctomycetota bacterium]